MAKAAALVITGISIALLVIYGADAAAGAGNPDHQGFLDMDHMTRGLGLGGPAMVLPLIAYFISRNDSSKGLGGSGIGYRTAFLKMYGKSISKPQRKLGHFNIVDRNDLESIDQLLEIADKIKNSISITPLD